MAADRPRILVLPAGGHPWLADAVRAGGGDPVTEGEAQAVVWTDPRDAAGLRRLLDEQPGVDWVQLPWAGIDAFVTSGLLEHDVVFTCAKGAYDGHLAEHTLMLLLAAQRNVVRQARTPEWLPNEPEGLEGKRVTILGGGGIAARLVT